MTEPQAHPWIWAIYVTLFAASVPWYLPESATLRLWYGLPHWVVISLAVSLSIAVFTTWVVSRYWSEPDSEEMSPGEDHQQ